MSEENRKDPGAPDAAGEHKADAAGASDGRQSEGADNNSASAAERRQPEDADKGGDTVTGQPAMDGEDTSHAGGSVPTAVPQPESEAASVTADEPPAGVPAAKQESDDASAGAGASSGAGTDGATAGEAANGAGSGGAPADPEREAKLKAAAEARAARAAAKAAAEAGGEAANGAGSGDAPVDPELEAKRKAAAEARAARAAAKAAAEGGASDAPAEPKPSSRNQPLLDEAAALLRELVHGDAVEEAYINEMNGELPTLVVKAEHLPAAAKVLKDHDKLRQRYLRNVSGVDYETHMEVVYHLVDLESRRELAVKVKTDRETPSIPSVTPVWPTANWNEREIYDLLGVDFPGHPDLRRIMMPDDWVGHPLRKDYEPLDPEV